MESEDPVTRSELHIELAVLRTELGALEERVTGTIRQVETNLLTAFHSYAQAQQARFHTGEVIDEELRKRMAALEERVLLLETRRPPAN